MADISKIERKGILYNIKDATARNLLQQKYTVPIGGIPKEDLSLEVQNLLQAAKTAIQNYTETDPTVPAWAKSITKPTYTAQEVGALPSTTHIPVDPVNADWNASSGLAQILNKPALFSGDYNDLINKPVIPSGYDDTDLSGRITALENAGFITQESDPTVPSWAKASTKPSYTANEVGALPADTVIPVIPTNVSSFVNDAGYLTQHQDISGKANISDLATVATSGSYNDLSDTPDVPIAISVNEQSFVMNQFHAFVIPDYYTKTQIDNAGYVTSSDVADAVADLVDSAPSTLDTLNELAAALGDDPNFATTIATALGNKVDKEVGKGLFSGSYNDLTNKPTIPSAYDDTALTNRVSVLENAGFLTSETDPNVPAWAKAATKPSYTASEVGALPDTTVIPTATSQLTNDSGFLTTHQDISGKADVVTIVTNSSTGSVSQALDPNKFYKFTGALTALTLTLNAGTGLCIYAGKFTSDSSTACTVTLPSGVKLADNAPSVEAGGTYEFSIADNLMLLVKEGS